jgi:hypothetical protein
MIKIASSEILTRKLFLLYTHRQMLLTQPKARGGKLYNVPNS